MAVTREQFEAGMSYEAYKAQMTRNKEQFEANEKAVQVSEEDARAFSSLPRPLKVLALAEDWCGDVIANLPVLGRVAQAAGGKLDVRVLLRDQEPGTQVMDQYLNKGEFRSIPVFVFLDEGFNEVGVFIERPDSVTELRAQKSQEIFGRHPEWTFRPGTPPNEIPEDARPVYQQEMAQMRAETAPFANGEVVRELREIVSRAGTPA